MTMRIQPKQTFRLRAGLYFLAIAGCIGLGFYLVFSYQLVPHGLILMALSLFPAYRLLLILERGHRDLRQFMEAIQYADFTQSYFSPVKSPDLESYYGLLNKSMRRLQDRRAQEAAHQQYLETLVRHVGIALLCYKPDGEVVLINNAAKNLFNVPALHTIQHLESISRDLSQTLLHARAGEQVILNVTVEDESLQLSILPTRFLLEQETYLLVSIQDIGQQLEDKELEAMQQMTRVLAHEIMNSVTPIASLASSARDNLNTLSPSDFDRDTAETLTDMQGAFETIDARSQGLIHFVNAYRKIARIPKPELQLSSVAPLFNHLVTLFSSEINQSGIQVHIQVSPPALSVLADPDLIQQVLINLFKNALEAIGSGAEGEITLIGQLDRRSKVVLIVRDSGPGISADKKEKIFVPFFTTKKEGSGIGLSLSRQIMRRHGGNLRVQSREGGPTDFILRFNR